MSKKKLYVGLAVVLVVLSMLGLAACSTPDAAAVQGDGQGWMGGQGDSGHHEQGSLAGEPVGQLEGANQSEDGYSGNGRGASAGYAAQAEAANVEGENILLSGTQAGGNGKGRGSGNGASGQGGVGQSAGGQGQGNGGYGQGVATSPLSEAEADALVRAIEEEYGAQALYQSVLDVFGDVDPFNRIVSSEAQHADALVKLAERYGVAIPAFPSTEGLPAFESLEEACQAGVAAEIADAALYDELMTVTTHEDILRVFTNLQNASLNNHLPAFEACQ